MAIGTIRYRDLGSAHTLFFDTTEQRAHAGSAQALVASVGLLRKYDSYLFMTQSRDTCLALYMMKYMGCC